MSEVLNLILTHQQPNAVARMLEYWSRCVAAASILIAHGGNREDFDAIAHTPKIFADDVRLRTSDHQREFQSYSGLFRRVADWLETEGEDFHFIHFAEYDHIPLVGDLNARQLQRLQNEQADVLGFSLARVDETNQPHFIYHAANPRFLEFWRRISLRSEPDVVLSIFGSGSFWTREAFCAVAAVEEPFPIYTELYLSTLAHHLGFRIRDFADQEQFVRAEGDLTGKIDQARADGGWTLHPVKRLWTN